MRDRDTDISNIIHTHTHTHRTHDSCSIDTYRRIRDEMARDRYWQQDLQRMGPRERQMANRELDAFSSKMSEAEARNPVVATKWQKTKKVMGAIGSGLKGLMHVAMGVSLRWEIYIYREREREIRRTDRSREISTLTSHISPPRPPPLRTYPTQLMMIVPVVFPQALACLFRGTDTSGTKKCHGLTPIEGGSDAQDAMDNHNGCAALDSPNNIDCSRAPDNATAACKCKRGMYAP